MYVLHCHVDYPAAVVHHYSACFAVVGTQALAFHPPLVTESLPDDAQCCHADDLGLLQENIQDAAKCMETGGSHSGPGVRVRRSKTQNLHF